MYIDVLLPKNKMVPARFFLVRVYDRAFLVGTDMLCFFPNNGDSDGLVGSPAPKTTISSWWIFGHGHHLLNTSRFCWLYQVVLILSLYTMYINVLHQTSSNDIGT